MDAKNIARQVAAKAVEMRVILQPDYDEFVEYIVETAEELDLTDLAKGDKETFSHFVNSFNEQ